MTTQDNNKFYKQKNCFYTLQGKYFYLYSIISLNGTIDYWQSNLGKTIEIAAESTG